MIKIKIFNPLAGKNRISFTGFLILQTALKDLLKGNWSKVWNPIKKWSLRKKARLRYEISLGFKNLIKTTNIL